uniref:Band 7 domain-containing protein n=1 Tax=Ditylum brightwellii TaxID=49249 RepID=A0A6U3ZNU0_9STRA|mmetsp:Transcript_9812/g.13151  ORF Transcript_9812/g.13151 Transcript_9812/m.13151 type:complete len:357 (+) Transcript_9812:191-1261(+)
MKAHRLFKIIVSTWIYSSSVSAFVAHNAPLSIRPNVPFGGGKGHATRSAETKCHVLAARAVAAAALTVGAAALDSIKVVNQQTVAVVERLGKFQTCLEPGLHFTIPLVDRVRTRLNQREQVFDIPPQGCITADNAPLSADAVVYWKIVDPKKAFYSVDDLELAIQNLVLTQLRSEIGKLTLDETFSAREQINAILLQDLDVSTEPWGVKISRVEVRDIIPNRDIMKALESQIAAERTKRATIIKSEGQKAEAINKAEGEAQSLLIDAKAEAEAVLLASQAEATKVKLEAEGAANAIAAIAEVLGSKEEASRFQLAREYIAAQESLATSENAKIILSSDAASKVLAEAMAFAESLEK